MGKIRGKRHIIVIGLLALLIVLALISNILVLYRINQTNETAFERYDFTSSTVTYTTSEGKKIEIVFGNESVKIKDSCRVGKEERIETLCFIRYVVKKREGKPPTFTTMSGEWGVHNFLYSCGLFRDSTKNADLEFEGDRRWYVRWSSYIGGFLGG